MDVNSLETEIDASLSAIDTGENAFTAESIFVKRKLQSNRTNSM